MTCGRLWPATFRFSTSSAALSVFLNDDALNGVVSYLLTALEEKKIKPDFVRTYVLAVGQIR